MIQDTNVRGVFRGMAAMALTFLAAFLLAPGAARAGADECDPLSGADGTPPHTATCADSDAPGSDGLFTDGIYYTGATPINVIVQGSAATTVTAANNGGWWSAIVVTTGSHTSETRNIDLDVGTTGNVAIVQSSNTDAITWYRHRGILVRQQAGGGSTIDVDVSHRVRIGEPEGMGMGPMSAIGIEATLASDEARNADTGAGAITIDSGATIYADLHGISLDNEGPGASTVGHTGAIVAATTAYFAGRTTAGIFVLDRGASGAVTVTSSGAITAGTFTASCSSGGHTAQAACEAASHTWYADGAQANGIFAGTTGKDAAGGDHGVSVTHSAGDIMAGRIGIEAHVGAPRDEGNTGARDSSNNLIYVTPENEGRVKVAVTGGSIRSRFKTIGAYNFEAGSVEVDIWEGVTLTTSDDDHAVLAQVADVGNTSGTVSVTNAGTINVAADGRAGIVAFREAGAGAVTVTNSGDITAGGRGIHAYRGTVTVINRGDVTADRSGILAETFRDNDAAGVSVTHSGGAIESANGRGILARVGYARQETDPAHGDYVAPRNEGLVEVEVTGGTIRSMRPAIEAINHEAGSVEVRVSEGVTLTSTANHGISARVTDVGNESGAVTVVNAGTIEAAATGIFSAVEAGSGDLMVTNSGAIAAGANASGIFALTGPSATGDVTVANSGAIGSADARVNRGIFASHHGEGANGAVSVVNSGSITAATQGILAQMRPQDVDGANDGVSVTHSGGAIDATVSPMLDSEGHGIVARVGQWRQEISPGHPDYVAPKSTGLVEIAVTGGSIRSAGTAVEGANYEGGGVEIDVSEGVTLASARQHGIEADLHDVANTGGTIKITQAGEISAWGDGINAKVTRIRPAPLDRPVIDVVWTGTYEAPEREPDASIVSIGRAIGRIRATHLAQEGAVQAAQAVEAVEVLRGGSAGVDAGVMSWQRFLGVVATGDDPGAFADAAAQTALFADSADAATKARADAIVAQFRKTLKDGEVLFGAILGADAIATDDEGEYTREGIVTYLSEDSDARRELLRGVLAGSLTAQEMAVFRAVIEEGDVDAALAAVPGSSDAWKREVRALLESHHDGDIRIAMNGGSIESRGDGIRAFYAAHRDGNGRIEVRVAEGASVTGAMAGIYVAHAGAGLQVAKKYTSPAVQAENMSLRANDPVTIESHHSHFVMVDGKVTGGTDAAVHLAGGGALIVGPTGELVAGSSGRTVLVNDPQPAVVFIDGEVTGAAGPEDDPAPAAVHLTGGGSVTVGLNGMVRANGAQAAIRGDLSENGLPTVVTIHADRLTQGGAREALARVEGGIVGAGVEEKVTIAETTEDGATTGHMLRDLPLTDGVVPPDALDDLPPDTFQCGSAADGRCRLYEALPSMLLAMNDLPSYEERTSAARDGNGGWARVESARGEWQAEKAATAAKLAYDHRRSTVRAGVDLLAGESARVGVSAHALRGKAEMTGVGEAELDGMGGGLSATWLAGGGVYVDAQAAATLYDVDVESYTNGRLQKKDVYGVGYGLGVDVGRRVAMGGMTVTPRAGVEWTKVDLDDFTDTVGNIGAQVSVEDAQSTKGRLGLMVETETGSEESPGRVFGSVDVEHEFSDGTEVVVSGDRLETKVRKTGVRLGLGGVFRLGEDLSLRASAHYAASGGDTNEYGGGVELALRF